MVRILLIFTWICFLLTPVFAEEGLTLQQCYQLALKRSETIAINTQVIKEAEAQIWQSLKVVLPQVNYQISQESLDHSAGDKGIHYRRFNFSQPLFSGFKEFAAISGANALHRQRENELERARQLLFTDVSDAFYFLQSYQEDLNALKEIHKALEDRVAELKRRQNLGRSRESEVASAEAALYKAEADEEGVNSQLEVGRQLLEFLIGQPVTTIKDEDLPGDASAGIEDFVRRAESRPDVKASMEALKVARKNITVARSGAFPSVALNGNSYNQRTGSDKADWDVTLSVNVPIFTGGETIGLIKQAKAQAVEAELALSQTKRAAILDIQSSYTRFAMDQKREAAIKKAAEAANRNYQLQQADYRNSLVNNLDVIQALQDWETGYRDYIAIKNETKRFYWNLKVATGDINHDAF